MTIIEIRENEISIKGHSGYAEEGKDIVCAAISTLSEATYNYLVATKNKVNIEESDALYVIHIEELNEQGKAIISSFKGMINDIENQYPKYVMWRRI